MRLEELAQLNDEIAALVGAGLPLEPGLAAMGRQGSGSIAALCDALAQRMEAGASLSEALAAEGGRVPAVYRAIVEAGLAAGRLPAALEAVSGVAWELVDLRRRLGVALAYPLVVGVVAYGLFLAFITAALEQFRLTFIDFRYRIPPALDLLFQSSHLLQRAWWAPVAALAAVLFWWVLTGRAHLMEFSGAARPLRLLPGLVTVGRNFRYAQFAELLALLVEHEVPMPRGLRLAAGAAGDRAMRRDLEELARSIEHAADAAAAPRAARVPRYLQWVISQGSRRGGLPQLLRHAATLYRRRALVAANWLKLLFPVACSAVVGGGIALCYAAATFGPMLALWLSLGEE